MTRKLLIVWNEAKNEGVVFLDDAEGRSDAAQCANRMFGGAYSSLGFEFATNCYEDDELTIEALETLEGGRDG